MLRAITFFFSVLLLLALLGVGGGAFVFYHYGRGLPDYKQLAKYEPPTVTRLYAGDGRLIEEYATEKRVFVPIEAIPKLVIKAFLAAEDKNFYSHPGIDLVGVARAVVTNVANLAQNRRPVGASTITQQVAKNFLLSNELSLERKIKEAILAFRIEHTFSKDRILELYLNEIYLGFGSYGVAAAALNYFNKSLDELTVAEAAFLAALPKAPNNYNPIRYYVAAKARRDWVIRRMVEDGFVSRSQGAAAQAMPLVVRQREETEVAKAAYFVEEVRRELIERYGEGALYEGGLYVRTALDPHFQRIADRVLREGLITYDRRHGWRGPITTLDLGADWARELASVRPPPGLGGWRLAVVLAMDEAGADIGFGGGKLGFIPMAEMKWARPWKEGQRLGPPVRHPRDVLAIGDVVAVERVEANADGKSHPAQTYALRQIPEVNGALVALDPHTGRVLALTGGYSYDMSEFDRAAQAMRQPGSAFKPFVYLTALDHGFTPSTLVLDAPFVIDQGPGLGKWKPQNYSNVFYGPSPLRLGLEKSRNVMTVRLAQTIGIDAVARTAERLGIMDHMPRQLSMAIGAGETTLLRLTTAYAMLVNGGKRITPTLIDRIQDRHGRTVFRHDNRPCPGCRAARWNDQLMPEIPDPREQVADPASAYQVVSMLQGVVERGTGRRVRGLERPVAGKTGTTNDFNDAWFLGFTPDLVTGIYVGFDNPRSLGRREVGGRVAAPIFRAFMKNALNGEPPVPFRIPPGIRLVRVNAETGLPAEPGDRNVILEAFKPGTEPSEERTVINGEPLTPARISPEIGTGGLY